MPTAMTTITTTSDYRVERTDWLSFTNQNGFVLVQPLTGRSPNLTIWGGVDVTRTAITDGSIGVVGISATATFDSGPSASIDIGASLHVSAPLVGGVAFGYFANNVGAPNLSNAGDIAVTANAAASGVVNIATGGQLLNSGQITVVSTTSDATGARLGGGLQHFQNFGAIAVTGHGQVTGVDMGTGTTGQTFANSGTIVAHDDDPAKTSVGVQWGVGFQQGARFENSGRIEGDEALHVEVTYGDAATNLFTNNGVLAGSVWLGGGAAETLVNNGTITGLIRLIGPGSVYDGRSGSALGPIVGNFGGSTMLGGSGAETMTGGFGNDTISAGDGNDLIDGGEGVNRLDGGLGTNTISFVTASTGVTLDLAGGTARSTYGDSTLLHFTNVIGSYWNDNLRGVSGSSAAGGAGADTIVGTNDGAYLRGDEGDDSITGGAGFDDANGNMGNDTVATGAGDDYAVGGKDNDLLAGEGGQDIVWGNLGNDTADGGDGNDQIRGGQGDDSVVGGAGDDFVSGDRGNDTISGGTGADLFHTSQDAGIDRVLDFHLVEGDRVLLDPGTTYTVSQVGTDTVIDLGGGNQMILVGVQVGTLTGSWVVGA